MSRLTALECVGLNDLCTLDIICKTSNDRKRELEQQDFYGNTALLKACYSGKLKMVSTLLRFGADVKAVNYYGQNALTLATYANNLDLIKELLRWCPYKEFNKSTLTPAICVATMFGYWTIQKFYIELDPYHFEDIQTAHVLFTKTK
uniref:Uncharacterized protein n=1 Tax=Glossina brevipalpis TaxID=37001 RepID=A0A1A9W6X5_9MUSC